jgi:deoxyribose-phosphate aldolase
MDANSPLGRRPRVLTPRRVITVEELATYLDKRLYSPDLDEPQVREGCHEAVRQGVATAVTRPEHLVAASAVLQGTGVGLVTALGWHRCDDDRLAVDAVQAEAEELVELGATEVAYIVSSARIAHDGGREVARHVARLVDTLAPHGARARAILDTDEMTEDEVSRMCREMAEAGVWMVQGGSWRGRRAGLSQLEDIRAALPPEVLVKWTEPVRSVSTLLLSVSMGIERFNGDVDQLLGDAERAEWLAPLTIPVAGVDY